MKILTKESMAVLTFMVCMVGYAVIVCFGQFIDWRDYNVECAQKTG